VKKAEVETVIKDAEARGKVRLADLIREAGGLVSAYQAAQLLGITTQALDAEHPLIFVRTDDGNSGYPKFQFESEEMLGAVARVLSTIGVENPWMRLSFFFLCLDELHGRKPIEAIRDGELESVILAATHFGQHGAS